MEVRQILLLGLMLAALALQPTVVEGQQATTDTVFVEGERSNVLSGVIELYLPTVGFAYAGDWKRGLLPNALRIGSFIGLLSTVDFLDDSSSSDTAAGLWVIAFLGTTVWAVVEAVNTANDRNRAVRAARSQLSVAPAPFGGVSVGLRLLH